MNTTIDNRIDHNNLPSHIAVIMDGNGRWAKKHSRPRVFGHRNGVKAVREITEAAAEVGIDYLTLYAFSTENWNRPALEVTALMTLLVSTLNTEIATLNKNNIKLNAIGDLSKLPDKTHKALLQGIESTKNNTRMTLNLALNYSGRWELTNATKLIAEDVKAGVLSPEDISAETVTSYLNTKGIPDPELLIRSSGEQRISNYLLWQIAYTELHFIDVMWPDFRKQHLYDAIVNYQARERRFGKTGEQIKTTN